MKLFPLHDLDLAIEDCWKLAPDAKGGDRLVGGGHGEVWSRCWLWMGVVLREDAQTLCSLP